MQTFNLKSLKNKRIIITFGSKTKNWWVNIIALQRLSHKQFGIGTFLYRGESFNTNYF